jgi:predicted aspartyl protease
MGLVHVDGYVKHGGKSVRVRFLIDSGATYIVLKKSVREELGLEPLGETSSYLLTGRWLGGRSPRSS